MDSSSKIFSQNESSTDAQPLVGSSITLNPSSTSALASHGPAQASLPSQASPACQLNPHAKEFHPNSRQTCSERSNSIGSAEKFAGTSTSFISLNPEQVNERESVEEVSGNSLMDDEKSATTARVIEDENSPHEDLHDNADQSKPPEILKSSRKKKNGKKNEKVHVQDSNELNSRSIDELLIMIESSSNAVAKEVQKGKKKSKKQRNKVKKKNETQSLIVDHCNATSNGSKVSNITFVVDKEIELVPSSVRSFTSNQEAESVLMSETAEFSSPPPSSHDRLNPPVLMETASDGSKASNATFVIDKESESKSGSNATYDVPKESKSIASSPGSFSSNEIPISEGDSSHVADPNESEPVALSPGTFSNQPPESDSKDQSQPASPSLPPSTLDDHASGSEGSKISNSTFDVPKESASIASSPGSFSSNEIPISEGDSSHVADPSEFHSPSPSSHQDLVENDLKTSATIANEANSSPPKSLKKQKKKRNEVLSVQGANEINSQSIEDILNFIETPKKGKKKPKKHRKSRQEVVTENIISSGSYVIQLAAVSFAKPSPFEVENATKSNVTGCISKSNGSQNSAGTYDVQKDAQSIPSSSPVEQENDQNSNSSGSKFSSEKSWMPPLPATYRDANGRPIMNAHIFAACILPVATSCSSKKQTSTDGVSYGGSSAESLYDLKMRIIPIATSFSTAGPISNPSDDSSGFATPPPMSREEREAKVKELKERVEKLKTLNSAHQESNRNARRLKHASKVIAHKYMIHEQQEAFIQREILYNARCIEKLKLDFDIVKKLPIERCVNRLLEPQLYRASRHRNNIVAKMIKELLLKNPNIELIEEDPEEIPDEEDINDISEESLEEKPKAKEIINRLVEYVHWATIDEITQAKAEMEQLESTGANVDEFELCLKKHLIHETSEKDFWASIEFNEDFRG